MRPEGERSGRRKLSVRPSAARTALAAIYPARTAPSIVDGQPVWIQSPARNRFGIPVAVDGLSLSLAGFGEKVAIGSFTTRAFRTIALRETGSAWWRSCKAISRISLLPRSNQEREALVTNCR
jgi:hypothetical protein